MKRILTTIATLLVAASMLLAQTAPRVTRILAIGNSFSQDAVEQYLWEIGQAAGEQFVIGNMYIGGCTLERHAGNIKSNSTDYEYRKVTEGPRVNTKGFTLERALADEQWDIITVQQASGSSGIYETYHPFIDELLAYVNAKKPADCKVYFHQTWAYQQDSQHKEFPKYGSDQMTMYKAIMKAAKRAMKDCRIKTVIPSGTAVQNVRNSFIGDNMTRDGYHMNLQYGRYTVACTWFEVITGKSVVGNTYRPEGVSDEMAEAIQKAVHAAVRHPWKVTL